MANHRWRVVGISLIVVAIIVLLVRWALLPTNELEAILPGTNSRGGQESPADRGSELVQGRQEAGESNPPSAVDGSAITDPEATDPSDESARKPAEGVRLQGMVKDFQGEAIAGAVLTWTPLLPEWIDPDLITLDQDWPGVEAATARGTTQADGRFTLRAQPPAARAEGTVLWATKPGFVAEAVLLDPAIEFEDLTIVLESAKRLEVIVQDGAGAPVEGATVEYSAEFESRIYGSDPVPMEKRVQLVLRRTPTTGADGEVALPDYPDQFVVQARKGELVSDTRFEEPRGPLVLTLAGTFSATGRVTFAPGITADSGIDVTCRAREGYRRRRLAMGHPDLDGSWSIRGVPVLDVDAYVFRLNGEGVAIDEVSVEEPQVGEVVQVELKARPGGELAVHAVNDLGEDLPEALVLLWWQDQGAWLSTETRADRQGYCRFTSCPPGEISIQGQADGHLPALGGPVLLPDPALRTIELVFARAGTIRVTARHLGKPVPDFEVAWWVDGESKKHHTASGAKDGSFEITEVPPGEVWVIAATSSHAQSEPVAVTVGPDVRAEVDIELPEGLRGHGRIVSSADRTPIPGAQVHLAASYMGLLLFYRSDPAVTGPDGVFDIQGLSPGLNALFVEAPGYAGSSIEGFGMPSEDLDLGVIPLNPMQRLTVRLLCEGAEDLTGYHLEAVGPSPLEPRPFPVDGEVVCERVAPGDWTFTIWDSDRTGHSIRRRLASGRDWLVEVPVGRSGEIRVEVIPEPGSELPRGGWLTALYDVRLGDSTQIFCEMPRDGEHVFPRFPADSASFVVFDGSSRVVGSRSVKLSDEPSQTVQIELGGHRLVVQATDVRGNPLPGTRICASSLHSDGRWAAAQTAGADGRADIGRVAFDEVLVHLMHPTHGSRVGVRLRPEELPDGVAVVEIGGEAWLRAHLHDGEMAGSDVRAMLYDSTAYFLVGEHASDAAGILNIPGLSAGPHLLVLDDPRYWPSEHLVEASKSESPQPVEIRRLGGLSIEVLDPGGVPVSGLPVELISGEFAIPVAHWLSQDIVQCGASGLTTDLTGRIHVDGLPRGIYTWRITAGLASGLAGEVTVPGGETGELIVRLP